MPDKPGTDSDRGSRQELAMLAHEVRGALTAITGYAELLGRELSGEDRDRALEGIRRAAHRIDALLSGALGGAQSRSVFSEKMDISEIAARVVAEAGAISGRSVVLDAPKSACVAGSSDSLERALVNLVDNALKYSQAASEVEVRVVPDPKNVLVQVLDRGPGVPQEDAETIFEPFFRLTGQEAPGTGLGLTVVKGVAEAHRGRVWVEPRTGGGSIFNISLPVAGCEG